jgi:hypothetical protein
MICGMNEPRSPGAAGTRPDAREATRSLFVPDALARGSPGRRSRRGRVRIGRTGWAGPGDAGIARGGALPPIFLSTGNKPCDGDGGP